MFGKQKSPEFVQSQAKTRFGQENFMFEKGKSVSIWITDVCFVGNFKTRKQITLQLKISKQTIKKYYENRQPYFVKGKSFGFWFYDIPLRKILVNSTFSICFVKNQKQ